MLGRCIHSEDLRWQSREKHQRLRGWRLARMLAHWRCHKSLRLGKTPPPPPCTLVLSWELLTLGPSKPWMLKITVTSEYFKLQYLWLVERLVHLGNKSLLFSYDRLWSSSNLLCYIGCHLFLPEMFYIPIISTRLWFLSGKESSCQAGNSSAKQEDIGLTPGLGRSVETEMATHSSAVWMHYKFSPSSCWWTFGLFIVLVIINIATISFGVAYFFFQENSCGISGSYDKCMFNFLKLNFLPKSMQHLTFPLTEFITSSCSNFSNN